MASATPREEWSSGDAYEAYVGRWSRLVAGEFVAWWATRRAYLFPCERVSLRTSCSSLRRKW